MKAEKEEERQIRTLKNIHIFGHTGWCSDLAKEEQKSKKKYRI